MPLSLEKQVTVTLYYLADGRRMRKAANAFGIGKSIVLKVVRRVWWPIFARVKFRKNYMKFKKNISKNIKKEII